MLTPPPLASFALAACSVMNDHLAVTSTTADCILDGSHHVMDLNLNDRYNLDVRIVMNWKNERLMSSEGILMVEVKAEWQIRVKGQPGEGRARRGAWRTPRAAFELVNTWYWNPRASRCLHSSDSTPINALHRWTSRHPSL